MGMGGGEIRFPRIKYSVLIYFFRRQTSRYPFLSFFRGRWFDFYRIHAHFLEYLECQ